MNEKKEFYEIDLLQLAKTLLKKWWAMLLAVAIGGFAFYAYSSTNTVPTYQAKALFYVNGSSISVGSGKISLGDVSLAKSLVETYRVIIGTRRHLEKVIEVGGYEMSYESLKSMISTEAVNETEIFNVTVTATDPDLACDIANTIAWVLPVELPEIIEGASVKVVDYAVKPNAYNGNPHRNNAIKGGLIGLVLSAAIIVILDLLDNSVKSEEWISSEYGDEIPLLATIPDNTERSSKTRYYARYYGNYISQKGDAQENAKGDEDGR